MLALNILGRSYGELAQPLDYDQVAPPLFLWIVKAVTSVSGGSEAGLRGFSFVAGIAVLVLLWRVSRRMFSPEAAAAATLLAALSPTLIYYSAELKPYMGDAAIAVGLLSLAWTTGSAVRPRTREWILLAAGLIALGLSFTTPFVLATAGGYLMCHAARQGDRIRLLRIALIASAWLLTFLLLYLLMYRDASRGQYLQEFWTGDFFGRAGTMRQALWQFGTAITDPLPLPIGHIRMGYLLPVLLLLAAGSIRRFGWLPHLVLGSMLGLLLLASWLGFYPVDARLVLFLAPLTLMVVAAGLVASLEAVRVPGPIRGVAWLGATLACVAWTGGVHGRGPGADEGDAHAIRLAVDRPGGDAAYILPGGGPKWVFYATDWEAPEAERLRWFARHLTSGGAAFRNARVPAGLVPESTDGLSAPGDSREILAYTSGAAGNGGRPAPGWAATEVRRLIRSGHPTIWLYGGAYHERDLPDLLQELGRAGGRWAEMYRDRREVIGVVAIPRVAPE